MASKILIGWGQRDVTPGGKVSLWGCHFVRVTEELRDPVTTTALALSSEDGAEMAIIVSLDAIAVTDPVTEQCRRLLSDALPDFRPEMLMMSGTHTHSAPDQLSSKVSLRPDLPEDILSGETYSNFVAERICEAVVEAWRKRAPGGVSWGRGYAAVGFNRRATYLDGSSKMYGSTAVPEFSHIEGHEDHAVDLLFTYDKDHTLTGMIVFEYFLDYGDRIKGRSKALQTFIVQLAGQGKYLLTERAWRGGSYGATVESSPVGPEGGQMLVEAAVAAINEMFEEDRTQSS